MPKGKPWYHAQVKQLQESWVKSSHLENREGSTSTFEELILPEDLPSVEMTLIKLAAAMKALEDPKLTKTDVMRLRTLIHTCTVYQKLFAEYVGYRRIERRLIEANEMFERLRKEREEGTKQDRNNI